MKLLLEAQKGNADSEKRLTESFMRWAATAAIAKSPIYFREEAICAAFVGIVKGVKSSIENKVPHLNRIKKRIRGSILNTINGRHLVGHKRKQDHAICFSLDIEHILSGPTYLSLPVEERDFRVQFLPEERQIVDCLLEDKTYKEICSELKIPMPKLRLKIQCISEKLLTFMRKESE